MSDPNPQFYIAGGTVPSTASSYVVRQADQELLEGLRRGEFCYVLTSRQIGKSSLMSRCAALLRASGSAVAEIDLTGIGQNLTVEQWYDGLVYELGSELKLKRLLQACWQEHAHLGPLHRFLAVLREGVLPNCSASIIIFVDEIEIVRSLPFCVDEFFAAIREVYNRRAADPEWKRITFCLLGMATPTDLIQNPQITPFNVGHRIEMHDFTAEEVRPLAQGLGQGRGGKARLLSRILYWTAGHPYLTQRLCQAVAADPQATRPADVDRLCTHLFLSPKAQNSETHLASLRDYLLRRCPDPSTLLDLYQQIILSARNIGESSSSQLPLLKLSGILRREHGTLCVRNRIYAHVFDLRWIQANLPDAELRRQRVAYRRGLLRATLLYGALLLFLGTLTGFAWQQRYSANRAQRRAEVQTSFVNRLLYASNMQLSQKALQDHNVSYALELLEAHRADPLRNFDYDYLWNQCHQSLWECREHTDRVYSVAFSPRSQQFATAGADGYVKLWDAATGRCLRSLGHFRSEALRVAYSPQGDLVAIGLADGTAHLYQTQSWKEVRRLTAPGEMIFSLAFSPTGDHFAVGCFGGGVRLWDTTTWKELPAPKSKAQAINSIAFSSRSNIMAIAEYPKGVSLWNLDTLKPLITLSEPDENILCSFSPDGQKLAVAGEIGTISLYETKTWKRIASIPGSVKGIGSLAFSPDGKWLAAGCSDSAIEVWDAQTLQHLRTLNGHVAGVTSLAFSPDGHSLVSVSHDRVARVWDSSAWCNIQPQLTIGRSLFWRAAISPDLKFVVTRDNETVTNLSEVATGKVVWSREIPYRDAPLAFSADGSKFIIAGEDGILHFLDLHSRRETPPWNIPVRPATALALSPDGKIFARSLRTKQVEIWDLKHLALMKTLPPQPAFVRCLAFSPDGKLLAIGGQDKLVHIWNFNSSQPPLIFRGHQGFVQSVAFSPDGKCLASGSSDAQIKLWNVSAEREVLSLAGHSKDVIAVRFDASGETLLSVGREGTVQHWRTNKSSSTQTLQHR